MLVVSILCLVLLLLLLSSSVRCCVDHVFIFVGDGQGISQTDLSLQCQRRVRAQVFFLFHLALYLLDSFGSVGKFILSIAFVLFGVVFFCPG